MESSGIVPGFSFVCVDCSEAFLDGPSPLHIFGRGSRKTLSVANPGLELPVGVTQLRLDSRPILFRDRMGVRVAIRHGLGTGDSKCAQRGLTRRFAIGERRDLPDRDAILLRTDRFAPRLPPV